ncbi:MAG: sigma factor-like helix-turn-helix DNA-binding protein, partial [Candidatus Methanomethylicaceae archaeon]
MFDFFKAFGTGSIPNACLDMGLILEFGKKVGLISPAIDSEQYVFPLAHLLSCIFATYDNVENFGSTRRKTPTKKRGDSSLSLNVETLERIAKNVLTGNIGEALSLESLKGKFKDPRAFDIAMERVLFPNGKRPTLQELGESLGITRERVRQLERKLWIQVAGSQDLFFELSEYLLTYFMRRGSLVIRISDDTNNTARNIFFICKALGVPIASIPPDLYLLGVYQCHIPNLKIRKDLNFNILEPME